MSAMPRRITSLIPTEVSHVDKGANKRPYFLVKSDDGQESELDFQGILALAKSKEITEEQVADLITAAKSITEEQAAELIKTIRGKESKEHSVENLFDVSKIVKADGSFDAELVLDAVKPLVKQLVDGKIVAKEGKVDLGAIDKSLVEIVKAVAGCVKPAEQAKVEPTVSPDIAALQKSQQELSEKLQKAEADLATERIVRLQKEFEQKAETKFGRVAAAKEIGSLLLKCNTQLDKETFAQLEKIFETANERIEKSNLFGEVGSSVFGAGTGSAYEQLQKKADEINKSETKLTKEQSFARAITMEPTLYKQYLADREAAQ